LNQDIKEGLMNVLLGEEKYNGQNAKISFFMERLKEARNSFLNDVIQPEIIRISKDLGFRAYPTAKFTEIDLKDETQYMRTISRLMELSILTPEQGIEAIQTGKLPDASALAPAQEQYISEREKGYYNPIVGGVPVVAPAVPAAPTGAPTNSTSGRPLGTPNQASRKDIQAVIYEVDAFMKASEDFVADKFKVKKLSKQQKQNVVELCKKVVASSDREAWVPTLQKCMANLDEIEKLKPLPQVSQTADEFLLEEYSAAIFYHSAVK